MINVQEWSQFWLMNRMLDDKFQIKKYVNLKVFNNMIIAMNESELLLEPNSCNCISILDEKDAV